MTASRAPTTLSGSVTHGAVVWDGSNWVNQLISQSNLSSTLALPAAATATTQSGGDSTTAVATTAFVAAAVSGLTVPALAGGIATFGPNAYCTTVTPALAANSIGAGGVNAGRAVRVMMPTTGHLRDVSVLVNTGLGGNSNILIFDTGQAAATHTTRTCLAASGAQSTPASGNWVTYDPNLSVTSGQTMELVWAADNTTDKIQCVSGFPSGASAGSALMPSTSWLPSSGAGTTNQILSAAITGIYTATATSTVLTASWVNALPYAMFVFRVT